MKIAIVISTNDTETSWNASRFANFCIGKNGTELCPLSTMNDLYEMVKETDKVVTF